MLKAWESSPEHLSYEKSMSSVSSAASAASKSAAEAAASNSAAESYVSEVVAFVSAITSAAAADSAAAAAAMPTPLSCTFGMLCDQTNSDGSASFGCGLAIWLENIDNPFDTDYNENYFYKDVDCDSGSHTVQYRGRTWEFRYVNMGAYATELGEASISVQQVDNGGSVLEIAPADGGSNNDGSNAGFSSNYRNTWWRTGITC
ncbi:hypothetical protein N7474_002809 [Penicillium riverlandense]|uniref:uncharacterized protein n=1 Tax=Penicillium riverlandense TaxID=1903569 RepID=UPI0025470C31|nr:uncharacterized protein N7474_002809 [Penicillium riverlandense]KAJ5825671.1 hypothetical protein N7474_002809 [Penicillium riverlandense]